MHQLASWLKNLTGKRTIFLDYASATPVLKEARQAMEKYWSRNFHNPSAIYEEGNRIRREIDGYRTQVARLLGVTKNSIIFTSGGTESNNLAILGSVQAFRQAQGKKPHIVISAVEHAAIQAAADEVEKWGGEVSVVPVDEYGRVSPENVLRAVKHNTVVVSIMLANNEIGTVQNISKIGRLIRDDRKKRDSAYPYFHTDASQAPSYLDVNMEKLQSDLMTLDGSKIYGPKGIGALVVRGQTKLRPLILGGAQEKGLRSGTENPALIAGFTAALIAADRDREKETKRLKILQAYLKDGVEKIVPNAVINTPIDPPRVDGALRVEAGESLPNILSVSIPHALSELMLLKLEKEGVLVSVGSACSRDEMESGSPVIRALGKSDLAESTLRFSCGRETSKEDIDGALKALERVLMRDRINA